GRAKSGRKPVVGPLIAPAAPPAPTTRRPPGTDPAPGAGSPPAHPRRRWAPARRGPRMSRQWRTGPCAARRAGRLPDRAPLQLDLHFFPGEDDMGKVLLALVFHSQQELVIVVRVVVGEGQLLHPRLLGHLDRLRPATVAPALLVLQFLRGVLGLVNE